ncbi:glycoside hydrolase [Cristinia sonorae]|uniref:non-reducing end alpha-L-arabinofuranosidase n=1 Tax=Cristinia sonorae TaxID=1940300 RepID=A0A8K0XLY5_9AGAR|nr:glycoside hydrolase [Cristinia sonorae]
MATTTTDEVHIDVFPSAPIAPVSEYIFSGFLEHLGKCIYGGILPASPDTFPHSPRNLAPADQFTPTPKELLTPEGFRKDVLEVLRDELNTPLVRWPGGNYVSSYHWEDGVGPLEERRRRPELAWGGEESNLFGTDEFIAWCRVAKIEPFLVLNMGTGTLREALNWIEYCNGTGDTYYANLRRKNTGKDEPHNVKYWALGNEVWGWWQVGQETASAYAVRARQWAHAIKLIDPNVKLVGCGETGLNAWDGVVLDELVDKVDLHSIHLYTGFGVRDRTKPEREYGRSVYGPDAAEYAIEIARGLINKARILKNVSKPITLAFDEYGVWDNTVGTPANGLRQIYTFTDALAMASWLNVFVRQADIVEIACIAQSVNVISPLIVGPTGLFRQTIYWPLYLFSKYMRGGTSLRTSTASSPRFTGETLPEWIGTIKGAPSELDVSAVLHSSSSNRQRLCVSVVNRAEHTAFEDIALRVPFEEGKRLEGVEVEVNEMWEEDLGAVNGFENPERVVVKTRKERWSGRWTFKEHSFTLFVFDL